MHEFIAKKGLISQGNAQVSGSLVVRDGITGSLYGTASYAIQSSTASYADFAQTASYAFTSSYEIEVEISSSWASASISASHALDSDRAISASYATSGQSANAETASLAFELSRSDAIDYTYPHWVGGKLSSGSNLSVSESIYFRMNTEQIALPDNFPALTINQADPNSYNLIRGFGAINNYLQFALRNTDNGNLASSDFIAEADDATESSSYADFGINNSGYSYGALPIFLPHDAYVYGSTGNMLVGTLEPTKAIKFFTGTDLTASVVYIDVTGLHASGSLEGTASVAISSSNTISSSYAVTASTFNPGSPLYVVSGSNGVPPAYLEPYDYANTTDIYRPPYKAGRVFWDSRYDDWAWYASSSNSPSNPFRMHLGKEVSIGVHNPLNVTMSRMTVVYLSGSSPGEYRPDVHPAIADGSGLYSQVVGVIRNDIGPGENGYMLTNGVMHRTNMGTFIAGEKLWLSPSVPGGLTNVRPQSPYEQVLVGYCSEAGALGSFICRLSLTPPNATVFAGVTVLPTITNNNDGTITVSTSSVNIFPYADGSGNVVNYPISQSVLTVTTGSNVTNYVYVDYNGGNPIYGISITNPVDNLNTIGIAIVNAREDGPGDWDIDLFQGTTTGLALANKLLNRDIRIFGFVRESGFTLSETGSLGVALTAGTTWRGVTRTTSPAVDSISGGSEFYFWYHSASLWTFDRTTSGSISNKYYDGGTNLDELSSSYYNAAFVYRLIGTSDEFVYVLAPDQYADLNTAKANSQPPGDLPVYITSIGLLVGRIIVQSGSTNFAAIDSAFTTTFIPTTANTHNSLIGLQGGQANEFFHLTAAEYSGSGTGAMVRQFQPTMSMIRHLGATPGHIPYWTPEQTLTYTGSISVVGGEHVLINSASFPDPANPEALLVFQKHTESVNLIGGYSEVNSFSQIYNQNLSSGSEASTDFCATANSGSQYENYIDMGIGGSGYASVFWPWVGPFDGYIQSHGGDLWLATITDTALKFTFNNTASTNYADKTGFYLSGSLYGTASRAVTASLADKATDLVAIPTTAVSASWASHSLTTNTASYISIANVDGAPPFADSSSYAGSASIAAAISFIPDQAYTASYFITSSVTSASYAVSASWAPGGQSGTSVSASWASASISASYSDVAVSASYVPNLYPQIPQDTVPSASWVSASAYIINSDTASYVLNAVSASYVPNLYPQQFLPSSSWASASISASYAVLASDAISASYVPNLYPQVEQVTVPSASWVSASAFITTAQTASFVTASNVVGVITSASYATIAENAYAANSATSASHALFADQAASAVNADTASYFITSSVTNATSASYAISASWVSNLYPQEYLPSASWASASISASHANVADIANAISFVPSAATSASWASSSISASHSQTASYALGIPVIKSGIVAGTLFAGNPKTSSIVFTTAFPNNNYSVVVTGEPSRTWTIQNKVSGSFQINANNNTAFTTNVFWQAISTGEYYS